MHTFYKYIPPKEYYKDEKIYFLLKMSQLFL